MAVPNLAKPALLADLQQRFGQLRPLPASQSLFDVGQSGLRIYVRYSRVHDGNRAFFGLRKVDLLELAGRNSYVCFITDTDIPPVFLAYADFEELFGDAAPARDGQLKVQLLSGKGSIELYVARVGRFNVEPYVGIETLQLAASGENRPTEPLSHSDVQALLSSIGSIKGYQIHVPLADAERVQRASKQSLSFRTELPLGYESVKSTLAQIDVLWIAGGSNRIESLFEIEHSTTIYSGLLRFNDVLLTDPKLSQFTVVSNEVRRVQFSRQLSRPTFIASGLAELTSFLEYNNVYEWHHRLQLRPQTSVSRGATK